MKSIQGGGSVIIDQKHLKFGAHIKTFMLNSILQSDVVLIILTPKYKQKADALVGGAGFEYNIINEELFKVVSTNVKYIPVLREGTTESSVTTFLKGFKYVDLRPGKEYQKNFGELIEEILSSPAPRGGLKDTKKEKDSEYKDLPLLMSEMEKKGKKYFDKLMLKKDQITPESVKGTLHQWEDSIEEDHREFMQDFGPEKMTLYADFPEDFKQNVFKRKLWTVNAALTTPDPDLARYKMHFRDAGTKEIFQSVRRILEETAKYSKNIAPKIDYIHLTEISQLQLDYLNEEGMFMNRIIGPGIRSEILHRYSPAYLATMTQPNMWGMYIICESANEFIKLEKRLKERKVRISQNWQYPYDRFTFLMNALANMLDQWVRIYGISLRPHLRFGYVNKFLASIHSLYKSEIKQMHEWRDLISYEQNMAKT